MKRTLFAIPIALLLLALCLTACAEGTERATYTSSDYEYTLLDDGTAEITGYNGNDKNLTIPDQLDGHPVAAIGDSAFSFCSSLTSVSIPDSVTEIGANPFSYCDNLTKIIVSPDHPSLAVIDGVLFSKPDKRLICYPAGKQGTAYQIPSGIQIIGEDAFYECSSLTSVSIPDSVTAIGDDTFYGCSSLTSISIPDSVTAIGDETFYRCSSLTSVSIPDSVTAIGDGAFSRCSSLTLTVGRDSYAAQYCKENNLNYTYPDSLGWLNN